MILVLKNMRKVSSTRSYWSKIYKGKFVCARDIYKGEYVCVCQRERDWITTSSGALRGDPLSYPKSIKAK